MLNIFVGFEQTNKYAICLWTDFASRTGILIEVRSVANQAGDALGYIAEEPRGFLSTMTRQILRTHRPFRAIVMDPSGSPVLWVSRFYHLRWFVAS